LEFSRLFLYKFQGGNMSIEYRGENKWRFRVTKNGKKHETPYYSTKIPKMKDGKAEILKEVKEAHDEFKVDVQRNKILSAEKMKLNDLYELVVEKYYDTKFISVASADLYKIMYKNHIKPIYEYYKLTEIKKIDIQTLVNKKTDKYAPATVHQIYNSINILFSKAVEWDILENNPCSKVRLPELEKNNYEELLSKEEIAKLLYLYDNEPDTYHKLAFNLAFGCGLRMGEILGLKVEDIDFKNNSIAINKQIGKVKDKNGKTIRGEKPPKTKNSIRKVYAPDFVLKVAKEHIKQLSPMPITGNLFYRNESIMSEISIRRFYKNVLYENGIKPIQFHDLRHLKAVLMLGSGASVVTVARTLGDTIDIIMKTYAHTIDEEEIKAAKEYEHYVKETRKKMP